jgi:hypothetical protein
MVPVYEEQAGDQDKKRGPEDKAARFLGVRWLL